ncbi:hypothetical protein SAMN05421730_102912 [Anaerobium acetethylicum]|uniref:Uncharacterized protein n=1 Tax=Anaerobium acetethylicum TaxID=1619234 RepID=A0A1D3TXA4_9FIRM|nr:hypothetical protein SAMN05421730_102912 [Anaerobium acetethylicum]
MCTKVTMVCDGGTRTTIVCVAFFKNIIDIGVIMQYNVKCKEEKQRL